MFLCRVGGRLARVQFGSGLGVIGLNLNLDLGVQFRQQVNMNLNILFRFRMFSSGSNHVQCKDLASTHIFFIFIYTKQIIKYYTTINVLRHVSNFC